MKRIAFLASVAAAAMMAACNCCGGGSCPAALQDSLNSAMGEAEQMVQSVTLDPAAMAATYEGTIPAADGAGFEIVLELRADGTAHLTEKVAGEEAAQSDFDGTVRFMPTPPQIIVEGGSQPYYFNFAEGNLLMVGPDGVEPEMRDQYMLRRK